jgi:hypothetical protein
VNARECEGKKERNGKRDEIGEKKGKKGRQNDGGRMMFGFHAGSGAPSPLNKEQWEAWGCFVLKVCCATLCFLESNDGSRKKGPRITRMTRMKKNEKEVHPTQAYGDLKKCGQASPIFGKGR